MADVETGHLIYLIALLAVVGGWFFMQGRDGLNKTLQYAAVWGLIFIGAMAGVGLWQDISKDTTPRQFNLSESGQIILKQASDGHYYLTARVNDAAVRFVVDTGATDIVLTEADAQRAGIDTNGLSYLGRATTANGEVRTAYVRLAEFRLGDHIDRNVGAVVNEGEMQQSLLGMGYLQRWGRIEISQGEMILTR